MWQGLQEVLPIIIGCAVGIVVCVTYIVCLLLFERKRKKSTRGGKVEVYDLTQDQSQLVVPLNNDRDS